MIVLSVHLITYNSAEHLRETLESILKQKVSFDYEIVIGDDSSTDSTWGIIESYRSKYPEIIKAQQNKERLGILKNYKATLDRCVGNYVFDIAGDDAIKVDDALAKMVSVLKSNPDLGFVDSGFERFYEDTKKTVSFANRQLIKAPKDHYKKELLLGHVVPIGICYNRKLLYAHVNFDTYLKMELTIDDYPVVVDLAMHTDFERINEALHTYRVHYKSFSNTKSFESYFALKKQMKMLFDYFSNKYNFSEDIETEFNNNHNKELLFLAGYFEKKELGRETYSKMHHKTVRDYIHYYASQFPFIRKLIRLV